MNVKMVTGRWLCTMLLFCSPWVEGQSPQAPGNTGAIDNGNHDQFIPDDSRPVHGNLGDPLLPDDARPIHGNVGTIVTATEDPLLPDDNHDPLVPNDARPVHGNLGTMDTSTEDDAKPFPGNLGTIDGGNQHRPLPDDFECSGSDCMTQHNRKPSTTTMAEEVPSSDGFAIGLGAGLGTGLGIGGLLLVLVCMALIFIVVFLVMHHKKSSMKKQNSMNEANEDGYSQTNNHFVRNPTYSSNYHAQEAKVKREGNCDTDLYCVIDHKEGTARIDRAQKQGSKAKEADGDEARAAVYDHLPEYVEIVGDHNPDTCS